MVADRWPKSIALLAGLERRRRTLIDRIDRFQRSQHDFEIDDLTGMIPSDHVDTVDLNVVDFGLEFQHGVRIADDLTYVTEAWIEEYVQSRFQISSREVFSPLRAVDYGRVEDRIVREQGGQPAWVSAFDKAMPGIEGVFWHWGPLLSWREY
jgi:hypothetical protein